MDRILLLCSTSCHYVVPPPFFLPTESIFIFKPQVKFCLHTETFADNSVDWFFSLIFLFVQPIWHILFWTVNYSNTRWDCKSLEGASTELYDRWSHYIRHQPLQQIRHADCLTWQMIQKPFVFARKRISWLLPLELQNLG